MQTGIAVNDTAQMAVSTMNSTPNRCGRRKEKQMNAITKATSVAVLFALGLALGALAAEAPSPVFTRDAILAAMRKVNDYRLTQEPARKWDANPKAQGDDWIGGTYYTGVMALYRATGDKAVLDQAVAWAERGKWAPTSILGGPNSLTCCQTYLELYAIQKDDARMAKTRECVDNQVVAARKNPQPTRWGYVDSLYVSPPAIAMVGEITGDKKYYEYLDKVYWGTADALFDKEEGLFYRDGRYIGQKTPQGKKILWCRGNGWAMGGIPRIVEHLPADWPTRNRYIELLKTMAAAVAKVQQPNGLWRTNLADPDHFSSPDSSGTAFFCYAMAWGVREGHLDKQTYLPVIAKAWRGLLNCIKPDGRLGFAKGVSSGPGKGAGNPDSSAPYSDGLFLLSGEQVLKLADELARIEVTVEPVKAVSAKRKPPANPATAPEANPVKKGAN